MNFWMTSGSSIFRTQFHESHGKHVKVSSSVMLCSLCYRPMHHGNYMASVHPIQSQYQRKENIFVHKIWRRHWCIWVKNACSSSVMTSAMLAEAVACVDTVGDGDRTVTGWDVVTGGVAVSDYNRTTLKITVFVLEFFICKWKSILIRVGNGKSHLRSRESRNLCYNLGSPSWNPHQFLRPPR